LSCKFFFLKCCCCLCLDQLDVGHLPNQQPFLGNHTRTEETGQPTIASYSSFLRAIGKENRQAAASARQRKARCNLPRSSSSAAYGSARRRKPSPITPSPPATACRRSPPPPARACRRSPSA
uniref:ALOG domain-containing protein n=1 Tax=Aegilops tauschii subsp. strangulata TaxID=200361 RepID=A0A453IZD1_AEGTS